MDTLLRLQVLVLILVYVTHDWLVGLCKLIFTGLD